MGSPQCYDLLTVAPQFSASPINARQMGGESAFVRAEYGASSAKMPARTASSMQGFPYDPSVDHIAFKVFTTSACRTVSGCARRGVSCWEETKGVGGVVLEYSLALSGCFCTAMSTWRS